MKEGDFSHLADAYHEVRRDYPQVSIEYVTGFFREIERPLILDMGCGTGKSTRQIVTGDNVVIGCDREYGMIAKALATSSINTSYCVADSHDLPFTDSTFDVITAFGAFHWIIWTDKAQSMKEIQRVLKPGGKLIIVNRMGASVLTSLARKAIESNSIGPLLSPHQDYQPRKILEEFNWKNILQESFFSIETYTVTQALLHIQSMSAWNNVDETKREQTLVEFEERLKPEMSNSQLTYNQEVGIFSATNNKKIK